MSQRHAARQGNSQITNEKKNQEDVLGVETSFGGGGEGGSRGEVTRGQTWLAGEPHQDRGREAEERRAMLPGTVSRGEGNEKQWGELDSSQGGRGHAEVGGVGGG